MIPFWHDQKFWDSVTKFITILVAVLTVVGSLVGVFFGQGILSKWANDALYPKYTPLTAKVLLEPDSTYFYCVEWQANQPYHIDVSSMSTPVRMIIADESNYKQYQNKESYTTFYSSDTIFSSSIVYTPKDHGKYYVTIDNSHNWLPAQYSNQSTVFNISVEAYRSCSSE
jgi:hypothetical protein